MAPIKKKNTVHPVAKMFVNKYIYYNQHYAHDWSG